MIDLSVTEREGWLSLHEASTQMGVSAATLRSWADEGRVESYRTPGGHRRFRVGDGSVPLKREKKKGETRWRLLEYSALGHLQLASEDDTSRGIKLSPTARMAQREIERDLIRLCTQTLEKGGGDTEARCREIGQQYGKWSWRFGIAVGDAFYAMGAFRGVYRAAVVEYAFGMGEPNPDELNLWLARMDEIIDHVSVSMLEYRTEEIAANVGK